MAIYLRSGSHTGLPAGVQYNKITQGTKCGRRQSTGRMRMMLSDKSQHIMVALLIEESYKSRNSGNF